MVAKSPVESPCHAVGLLLESRHFRHREKERFENRQCPTTSHGDYVCDSVPATRRPSSTQQALIFCGSEAWNAFHVQPR